MIIWLIGLSGAGKTTVGTRLAARLRADLPGLVYLDGEIRENFDYPKTGTPCSTVFAQSFRIYPSGVAKSFPEDDDLVKMGFESYAGFPLILPS